MRTKSLIWFLPVLLLSACATTSNDPGSPDKLYRSGDMAAAAQAVLKEAEESAGRDKILSYLRAAKMMREAGQFENSNNYFAKALQLIEAQDIKAEISVTGSAADVLANPKVRDYTPWAADRIFLRLYSAMNYLELGDFNSAKVELRGVYDAQKQVESINAKRIEQLRAQLAEAKEGEDYKKAQENNITTETFLDQLAGNQAFTEAYANINDRPGQQMQLTVDQISQLSAADFENPFAHYMQGLLFALAADSSDELERAAKAFEIALSMAPQATVIAEDLAAAKSRQSLKTKLEPTVWVIHENGHGPEIDQLRIAFRFNRADGNIAAGALEGLMENADISIPIPVANPLFDTLLLAFPVLNKQAPETAYSSLSVVGDTTAASSTVASMEQMMVREFKNNLPGAINAALLGGLAKAMLNQVAKKELGTWSLLTTAGSSALTMADDRIWREVPREFAVVRLPAPGNGQITLRAPQGRLATAPLTLEVPADKPSIVFLTTPTTDAAPNARVLSFERTDSGAYRLLPPPPPPAAPEVEAPASSNPAASATL